MRRWSSADFWSSWYHFRASHIFLFLLSYISYFSTPSHLTLSPLALFIRNKKIICQNWNLRTIPLFSPYPLHTHTWSSEGIKTESYPPTVDFPGSVWASLWRSFKAPSCFIQQTEPAFSTLGHSVLYCDGYYPLSLNSIVLTKPTQSVTLCYHQHQLNG